MNEVAPKFVDLTDAAKTFGLSRRRLYELIHTRQLRAYRPGTKLLVSVAEVEAFIRSHEVGPSAIQQIVDETVEQILKK